MQASMPRTSKQKATRSFASGNPNTHALFVRVTEASGEELERVTRELNDAADASNDPRRWSQSDVVRALLTRWLRDRKPGELP